MSKSAIGSINRRIKKQEAVQKRLEKKIELKRAKEAALKKLKEAQTKTEKLKKQL